MKISLTWKQCEAIARYYEFQPAVFLLTEKNMLRRMKGTRKGAIKADIDELRKDLTKLAEKANEVLG